MTKKISFQGKTVLVSTTNKDNSKIIVDGIECETISKVSKYIKVAYLPDTNNEFLVVCYFFKIYIIEADRRLDLTQNANKIFATSTTAVESFVLVIFLASPLSVLMYISKEILERSLYSVLPPTVVLWVVYLGICYIQTYFNRNPIMPKSHRKIIMYASTVLNVVVTFSLGMLIYFNFIA